MEGARSGNVGAAVVTFIAVPRGAHDERASCRVTTQGASNVVGHLFGEP